MIFHSPFSPLDPARVTAWLSEGGFVPTFSQIHRLYYRWARPILPLSLRQRLQRRYVSRWAYKKDFIDSEMVDWVEQQPEGRRILSQLYPAPYQFVFVLTHDVETADGLRRTPRIAELEHHYGFRSCWNIVPQKYRVDPGILRALRASGHEIGVHGYNHDGRLFWSRSLFEKRAQAINDILREWEAAGFRAPMVHRHLQWMQALHIQYDASCFDYDPFQPFPGGVKSLWPFMAGRFVELPYTLPQDHTLFVLLGQTKPDIWMRKAEWLIRHRGVVLLITHPDYLNTPERMGVYEDFLQFLKSQSNGWHLLPVELAAYWRERWGVEKAGATGTSVRGFVEGISVPSAAFPQTPYKGSGSEGHDAE